MRKAAKVVARMLRDLVLTKQFQREQYRTPVTLIKADWCSPWGPFVANPGMA
jgi:hypothetical protein